MTISSTIQAQQNHHSAPPWDLSTPSKHRNPSTPKHNYGLNRTPIPWWMLLGAPAIFLVHPAIKFNFENVLITFFFLLSFFFFFYSNTFIPSFSQFLVVSLSWEVHCVASVKVKVLRRCVDGGCGGGWFGCQYVEDMSVLFFFVTYGLKNP